MKKFISMLLVCIMLVGALAGLGVFAQEATPTAEIISKNVMYGEKLNLMFAVKEVEGYEAKLEVTVNGEAVNVVREDNETIHEMDCAVFTVAKGVAAQNINTVYTATASLVKDGVATKGETVTYSVLEYLNERLYVSEDVTADQKAMYESLITYATNADKVLNAGANGIGDYVYVTVTGSNENKTGMYKKNAVITLTTDEVAEEGYELKWNANGSLIGLDAMAEEGYKVTAAYTVIKLEAYELPEEGQVPELLATFEFGANGSATHADGNDLGSSKSYTADGYTLSLTSMSKVFGPAYDAKGNSCIKFGTSSVAGSMSFTVPENVTEVKIYVAAYKAKTATVTINGTKTTLTTKSDNGQYDVITVDTTTTKTISFAVSSGYRAMLNTIEFIGYAQ